MADGFRVTRDWIENELLPLLRELSRKGTIVAYDSGIEPRTKGREYETPPQVFGDPHGFVALTDALTPVCSMRVQSSEMLCGKLTYAVRASDGTDHQALAGELLFAIVNKAGTFTTTPSSEPCLPDHEVYAISNASTLSSLWSITTSGSVATLNVTPSGSLTEVLYGLEYVIETFPRVPIIPA